MADYQVLSPTDQNFEAFTAATAGARAETDLTRAERLRTKAVGDGVTAQVAASITAAQRATSDALQRASLLGVYTTESELTGKPAGSYRVGATYVTWSGTAVTARTAVLAAADDLDGLRATALPRSGVGQSAALAEYGTAGQADWTSGLTAALSAAGPRGNLLLAQNTAGDSTYSFAARPALDGVAVRSDPGVVLTMPSVNGVNFRAWKTLTPLTVRVLDRPRDIALLPNGTGLEWLAQLATGDILRPLGLSNAASLDATALSRYRRNTGDASRTAGVAALSAREAFWATGSISAGIDCAGVLNPAVGSHASAAIVTAGAANGSRVGVIVEAGTEYVYLSTDSSDIYTGRYTAGAGYVETPAGATLLPTAAYSSVGGGQAEYAWRIAGKRTAEVYVNGRLMNRVTFSADVTSAGWGIFYNATGGGGSVAVRDPVMTDSSERAHLGKPVNISIHSDSVGFGEGLNVSWADALGILLRGESGIGRVTVTNRAVSGENSSQQLARLNSTGAAGQDLSILSVGINDQQQFVDPNTLRANLTAMVTKVRADGSTPVIVVPHVYIDKRNTVGFATSNYLQSGQYHAVIRRVAAELNVPVADMAAAIGSVDPGTLYEVTQDNLHPTEFGALIYAREIARACVLALTRRAVAVTATSTGGAAAAFNGALLTTTQSSLANGADYPNWTAATYDTGGWWSATNPRRLTVPAGVTRVRFSGYIRFGGSATGIRSVGVFKNGEASTGGVRVAGTSDFTLPNAGAAAPVGIPLTSGVIPVTPGDYFELFTFQDSGGTVVFDQTQPGYFSVEAVS